MSCYTSETLLASCHLDSCDTTVISEYENMKVSGLILVRPSLPSLFSELRPPPR